MNVPITREFLLAVEDGAKALRDMADQIIKDVDADPSLKGGSVERACQCAAERNRQTADLLEGWATRNRLPLGLPPRDA